MKFYITTIASILVGSIVFGQSANDNQNKVLESPKKNWQSADYSSDKKLGTSTDRSYQELVVGKKSKTIVVAIIDSGVDHEHEDLKDNMWVNEDEIPNNGIDDDKNGYVDDIHGWNFIGGKHGNVVEDNMEYVRILKELKPVFETSDSLKAKSEKPDDYKLYQKLSKKHNKSYKETKQLVENLENLKKTFEICDQSLKNYFQKEDYSYEDIKKIKSDDEILNNIKGFMTDMHKAQLTLDGVVEYLDHEKLSLDYHLNIDLDTRDIVGDNYGDVTERYYGNNDVKGERADHGTHVAGIVGAVRNNNIGIDGIATDVKIMSVRTVPDGDERDKDVANAILYAVENGAKIINMSFGKNYSSHPEVVDQAIKKAAAAGVLLVHAAGNNSEDNDQIIHYPHYDKNDSTVVKSWITVGASDAKKGKRIPGTFSNYGATSVDIFAPGVQILSTVPDSKYELFNGTSMAAPVVTGVAALVWSYYPDLTASDIRTILLESSQKLNKQKVLLPFKGEKGKTKVRFGELSTTGGIVNSYNALKMAETYK